MNNMDIEKLTESKNPDEFLNQPKSEKVTSLSRPPVTYNTNSKTKYIIQNKQFTQQFNQLYVSRISSMRERISKHAKEKWPNAKILKTVLDIEPDEVCVIIGTLYKDMKLKPNILSEYARDLTSSLPESKVRDNYCSEKDFLILEDFHGRVNLSFKNSDISVDNYVSGIVVACLGKDVSGEFEVTDFAFYGGTAPSPLPQINDDLYVAFISGLSVGNPKYKHLPVQLAFDYLMGHVGSSFEQKFISKITRLVIAGNSITPPEKREREFDIKGSLNPVEMESIVEPLKELDKILAPLSTSMHIDIMPGEHDPSNVSLPQQPLHHALLPNSSIYTTLHLVTNPYDFTVNGVNFLGTSGQSINNIKSYSTLTSVLDIMERTLEWGHLAPTAPDTLACYPFPKEMEDPLIIKETPHVYFVGNQQKFETKLIKVHDKPVRLISIPSFLENPMIILLNLKTLNCHPIMFDVDLN